jgi:hypothetical protein
MAARPLHHLLIADAPGWVLDALEKGFRGFYWAAKEQANGGQCLVAWDKVCLPYKFGGLGIKNLRIQGLALRSRWEWLNRTDQTKPWHGLAMIKDDRAREVFDSLIQITVGQGNRVLFWWDKWIDGHEIADIAPTIASKIKTRCRNSRTVEQALTANRWAEDIPGTLSEEESQECITIWAALNMFQRNPEAEDCFRWPSKTGVYTAKSTYKCLTRAGTPFPLHKGIWKCKATPRCKDFMWRALKERLWTSDRRFRHGLQDQTSTCYVCLQDEDTADHILMQCVVAREVWHICRQRLDLNFEEPQRQSTLKSWWMAERRTLQGKRQQDFDTLVCTISYTLWKNRNAWVFENARRQHGPFQLAALVAEEYNLIKRAWRVEERGETDAARE